jgi:hypothetical protein
MFFVFQRPEWGIHRVGAKKKRNRKGYLATLSVKLAV